MNSSTTKTEQPEHKEVTALDEAAERTEKKYNQIIFRDWCKACGICSAFCPKNVISEDQTGAPIIERPDDCIGCRFCELHCPDFAITIRERNVVKPVKNL